MAPFSLAYGIAPSGNILCLPLPSPGNRKALWVAVFQRKVVQFQRVGSAVHCIVELLHRARKAVECPCIAQKCIYIPNWIRYRSVATQQIPASSLTAFESFVYLYLRKVAQSLSISRRPQRTRAGCTEVAASAPFNKNILVVAPGERGEGHTQGKEIVCTSVLDCIRVGLGKRSCRAFQR